MSEILERRTLRYWRLSRKWNGQTPTAPKIKVQTALKQLKDIYHVTRPDRTLHDLSAQLAEQMIMGGQSKRVGLTTFNSTAVDKLESN